MSTVEKPLIVEGLLESLQEKTQEEKQVIVHCCLPKSPIFGNLVRIWQSTFLIDDSLGHRSRLLFADNITMFPYWTEVPTNQDFWFTLIFSGLPEDCTSFDLKEIIPEDGGFCIENIRRNNSDIYRVKIV